MSKLSIERAHEVARQLQRVSGLRWRSQVEFEEQCALRGWEYAGLWHIEDGVVRIGR